MTKKGEKKITKRSQAPAFWKIPRKQLRFTINTSSGTHSKKESYPLAVLMRDILHLVKTYREAKTLIYEGKIQIDGIPRKEPSFPIGLMDIVDFADINKTYRLIPKLGQPLHPIIVHESEKNLKLCKVNLKKIVKQGKIQYGLHDGRTILLNDEINMNLGDSCLIEVPSQKIIRTIPLQEGNTIIITKGAKVGQIGKILKIKLGTFSRSKIIFMSAGDLETELPHQIAFVVGEDKPSIMLGEVL